MKEMIVHTRSQSDTDVGSQETHLKNPVKDKKMKNVELHKRNVPC